MNVANLIRPATQFMSNNSTIILTTTGVVGTVTTAILAGRAGLRAADVIQAERERRHDEAQTFPYDAVEPELKEKLVLIWPELIPPVTATAITVTAIIFAHRISAGKIAALATAYGVSERAHAEYKDKIEAKFGEKKAQEVSDELSQDAVTNTPMAGPVILADGEVLCLDLMTRRYFRCSVDKIKKAQNRINELKLQNENVSLTDFYEEIDLEGTMFSDMVGWSCVQPQMKVVLGHALTEDERPCLTLDFHPQPTTDYYKL